jgi:hypothetical protein
MWRKQHFDGWTPRATRRTDQASCPLTSRLGTWPLRALTRPDTVQARSGSLACAKVTEVRKVPELLFVAMTCGNERSSQAQLR